MEIPLNRLPLVSIIVNNFNYGQFVAQAIESALQQTYTQVEVIVVDDGSSDDSHQIIQGYGERIVLILKENGGQASALNAGFAASHGEIVVFLDADDLLLPSMVKDVVEVFLTRQEIIRVQYQMAVIDEFGKHTGAVKPERHIPVPSGDVHKQALSFPFDMPWLPTSGNVFSAKVLRQIMPIPEDRYGSAGADWYLVHLTSHLDRFSTWITWKRVTGCILRIFMNGELIR
jgi:glycosyltransferase involved in cell wall biosynthesis